MRTPSGETRLCPVCDSEIYADARVCDFCQSDLRVFEVDAGASSPAEARPPSNLDALIASIAEGKEVRPEFFEDVKNVGKAATPGEPASPAPMTPSPAAAGPLKFECPECGAEVVQDARECPSCSAQFSEEAIEQFECPSCHQAVPADASSCPNCGVGFAPVAEAESAPKLPAAAPTSPEARPAAPPRPLLDLGPFEEESTGPTSPAPEPKPVPEVELRARIAAIREARGRAAPPVQTAERRALYRELPRLVSAVKPLLLGAKRAGVDIDDQKKLINEAIASGKSRDIEKAVRLVSEAKHRLMEAFASQLADRAEGLVAELERAKATGGNMAPVRTLLVAALEPLENGQYLEASDRLALAREEFETRATGYHRARETLAAAEALAEDARAFGVDVRDAERLLRLGREAFARQEWDAAAGLGDQARAAVRKILPGFLEGEMKRARNALLDMKVRGVDLSRPIGILKQASIHLKREEFVEAMRYVRMYRREIESVQPASRSR